MDSTFSLSTTLSILFTIPKVRNGCFNSPTRYYSFYPPAPPLCLRNSCVASPLVHSQLQCVSKSASYSVNKTCSSATKGASEAIILDVGGMTSGECASSVKKILENHAHVYVASVSLSTETAIVWPTSDAKVELSWDRLLGDELANHLTSCGFKSNLREQENFHGCFKNTPYSEWPAHTISSLAPLDSELDSHAKVVEALKEKVKDLILNSTRDLIDNIWCINSLIRLGVSYHFKDEIEQQLNLIFTMLPKFVEDNDYDLCTVANFFRILRQNGYSVPCDVFEKFKDGDGGFKKGIANDVKGIICLYEACFVAVPGEYMLEEVLAFTRKHLEVLAENSSPSLQKYIRRVLLFPSHRTTERLDALHYISYYEDDEAVNEILLKFAKLDFNRLQLLYRKELALLSK